MEMSHYVESRRQAPWRAGQSDDVGTDTEAAAWSGGGPPLSRGADSARSDAMSPQDRSGANDWPMTFRGAAPSSIPGSAPSPCRRRIVQARRPGKDPAAAVRSHPGAKSRPGVEAWPDEPAPPFSRHHQIALSAPVVLARESLLTDTLSIEASDGVPATVPVTARHRPDIDGLRAVAVLAVILTHAGVAGFAGGFVGVDVFFVISGFLIYRDLVTRLREGRLSLLGFYGRRMRRTLPALYLVCAATLAAATFVMMPGDLDEMARGMIGAVLLVPNIVFLTQAGYFDAAATAKPLLHTWSLGVEEQFYLLAPLLPLALRGLAPGRRKAVLLTLFALALALCVGIRRAAPDAAFYLMPARAFEFLIGCLLAEDAIPAIRSRRLAEAVTGAAAAALALAIAAFSDKTPLPGALSLMPCLATAAIIHVGATRRTFVAMALGARGPAFIGLISYSLYLWHWPILVLARYADLLATPSCALAALVLAFGLSVLSWRYVETPFRDPRSAWRRRAPRLVPGAAALIVGCCAAVVATDGLPGRLPPDVASVASYFAYRDRKPYREGQCFITSKNSLADYDRATCLKIVPGKENVLLLGDSQAAHLWTGLRDTWPKVNVLQATASGCKPVVGTSGASRCTRLMAETIDRFIPDHHLDAIVIAGLWDEADIAPLEATIAALKPHVGRIVVFGPMPRYDQPLATVLAKSMLRGTLDGVAAHRLAFVQPLDAAMRAAIAPRAIYVSSWDALCPGNACRLFAAPGVPIQFDYHHLTKEGADLMMATIRAKDGTLF